MESKGFTDFQEKILKKRGKKNFKVRGSFGVGDAYKIIRKNGWYNIGKPVRSDVFYHIIRSINKMLAGNISTGETVCLPQSMGRLELRESKRGVSIVGGKMKVNYPIDWNETLRLWSEDGEARRKKVLLRTESKIVYTVRYNKFHAHYSNKSFYEFALNRFIKNALKKNINEGKINVLW